MPKAMYLKMSWHPFRSGTSEEYTGKNTSTIIKHPMLHKQGVT